MGLMEDDFKDLNCGLRGFHRTICACINDDSYIIFLVDNNSVILNMSEVSEREELQTSVSSQPPGPGHLSTDPVENKKTIELSQDLCLRRNIW